MCVFRGLCDDALSGTEVSCVIALRVETSLPFELRPQRVDLLFPTLWISSVIHTAILVTYNAIAIARIEV